MEEIIANFPKQIISRDWSISSWDLTVLVFWSLGALIYTFFFVSKGKIIPVLLATYVAFWLTQFLPWLTRDLAVRFNLELFELRLLAFAGIFLLVIFVLSRVILQSPVGVETFGILGSFVLSLAQVGFLTAVLVSFLPTRIISEFSPLLGRVFVERDALFYWAVVPIAALLLMGRKANREVG